MPEGFRRLKVAAIFETPATRPYAGWPKTCKRKKPKAVATWPAQPPAGTAGWRETSQEPIFSICGWPFSVAIRKRMSGVRRRRPSTRKTNRKGEAKAEENGRWGGAAGNSRTTRWLEPNCEGPEIPGALSGPKTPTKPRTPAQAGSGTSLEEEAAMHDPRRVAPDGPAANGGRQVATARAENRKGGDPSCGHRKSGFRNPPFSGDRPGSQHRSGIVRQAGNCGQRGVAGKR